MLVKKLNRAASGATDGAAGQLPFVVKIQRGERRKNEDLVERLKRAAVRVEESQGDITMTIPYETDPNFFEFFVHMGEVTMNSFRLMKKMRDSKTVKLREEKAYYFFALLYRYLVLARKMNGPGYLLRQFTPQPMALKFYVPSGGSAKLVIQPGPYYETLTGPKNRNWLALKLALAKALSYPPERFYCLMLEPGEMIKM